MEGCKVVLAIGHYCVKNANLLGAFSLRHRNKTAHSEMECAVSIGACLLDLNFLPVLEDEPDAAF